MKNNLLEMTGHMGLAMYITWTSRQGIKINHTKKDYVHKNK